MKKFIFFAPGYDENIGGVIVLHKLCSLLNELGYESYLYPCFRNLEINRKNFLLPLARLAKDFFCGVLPYATNRFFNTPVYSGFISDEFIVVYPENVFGNPLNAKNVVRWLLHRPDYNIGVMYFGQGELYFDFNDFAKDFQYPGSVKSKLPLTITHFPLERYNLEGALPGDQRAGIAYCIRKGRDKLIQHPMDEGIVIDGKSHSEVSSIFKKVKTFVSYDAYTAYSAFAALCGADSVVIPEPGLDKYEWHPRAEARYGVAYGFDDICDARTTVDLLRDKFMNKEADNLYLASCFAEEARVFFGEIR